MLLALAWFLYLTVVARSMPNVLLNRKCLISKECTACARVAPLRVREVRVGIIPHRIKGGG
jgi:hypothetical protein